MLALVGSDPAGAQTAVPILLQTPEQALAQDADVIAGVIGTSSDEALHQLRLQQASIAATDAIGTRFATRLAGIAIRHRPSFGIDVLLTGATPEPDETLDLAGEAVTVRFVTGATATHTELVQAITAYQATIRASLIGPPGMGIDPRAGELVVIVSPRDIAREGEAILRDRLAALTRVPVRLRVVDQPALDMAGTGGPADRAGMGGLAGGAGPGGIAGGAGTGSIAGATDAVSTPGGADVGRIVGGARVIGTVPGDPRHYLCTSGFAVTDGIRSGLATAAHCPDALSIRDADGRDIGLPFVGQWGWGHQDVQINASPGPLAPLFFADTARTLGRTVTGARSRSGMRAGDVVCHRGERTGYSCSQVELTDFAPTAAARSISICRPTICRPGGDC